MLSGWGRLPVAGREVRSEDLERLTRDAVLVRGLGRSYGDSSLPPPTHPVVAGSALADRLLAFDPATGVLRAEAGFTLFELNRIFWPRGFCAPVAPGTQFITLGGMVAADVHGKNHHRDGSFGNNVLSLKMRVADGRIVTCARDVETDLFHATLGGMGLTGHVLEVECRLLPIPSPWIAVESERITDIDRFIAALKDAGPGWPYSMGWIDCLKRGRGMGRGILAKGRWAEPGEAPPRLPPPKRRPSVPFVLPSWVVNRASVQLFNALLYASHFPRVKRTIMHPESFFYPLDFIREWNRLYGPRGFTQYQCVLPEAAGVNAARRFLELLTRRGGASMLCVIKDCGPEGKGLLSFPKAGISIALDIPVTEGTQGLVDALNEAVIAEGGRVYLAKDAFTRAEHFRAMEPRLPAWTAVRRKWDPEGRIRSAQSVRLFGDAR
ncbi:MAG TPA: FAD-binding oxidoreductase [Vicinamibacteria bacterium]|jgi:FAD/FMN-containing dehydrogenase|nr:FAD-binding oxidoreductase [Vicinamibacteria bacterium]